VETVKVNGVPYGAIATISVGASPFTWTNPESVPVMVYVSVGTVTDISVIPDGVTVLATGLLGGQYHLNPGQAIKVTYAVAPTMKYLPH
jgi:hypothetical protein